MGIALPRLVEGRHPVTQARYEVGLFQQCVHPVQGDASCDYDRATTAVWRTAAAFLLLG